MVKIVIVGGGPVGMLFGIFLSKIAPSGTTITVLELRKKYTRQQALLLNKRTLELIPTEIIETLIDKQGCYVTPPPFDRRGGCYKYAKTQLMGITISELEKELLEYLKKKTTVTYIRPIKSQRLSVTLGENVVSVADGNAIKTYSYDYLIGADGLHSQVRKTFFGEKNIDLLPETLYGLTMIIDVQKNVRIYDKDKKLPQLKKRQDRVRFFRQSNQSVYLAIALTPEEYVSFVENDEKIPKKFIPIIKQYLKLFDIECNDLNKCVKDMSYFPIRIFRASKFTDGKRFLLGDAAFNTHYFTGSGVNVGIDSAYQLANLLSQFFKSEIDLEGLLTDYINMMDKGAKFITERVLEIRTDYTDLWDKCKKMPFNDLKQLAKLSDIPYSYFNKKELCYLLKEEMKIK